MEHTDKSLDDLLNEANTWSKRGEDVKKAKFEPPRRKTPYPAKRPTEDDIDEDALPAAEPSADEDEDHEDYEDTDEALAVYASEYCLLIHVAILCTKSPCWRRGVVASLVRRMNEVTLRRARLVLGWVTVFGRVHHHGM